MAEAKKNNYANIEGITSLLGADGIAALLKDGRAQVSGLWSEKTGKTYDAVVTLSDDGTRASFHLVFDP